MSRTLIVGCSFIEKIAISNKKFLLLGQSGAGNQSISARTIYACSQERFKRVIVLWSGINRLDFPIGLSLHETMPLDKANRHLYPFFTQIGDMVWYHSGGFCLSGVSDQCPKFMREFFQQQYKGSTGRYLTDLTLLSMLAVQNFLQSQGLRYNMSFIYDSDKPYTDHRIEPGCGKIDRTSPLIPLIDWTSNTAFSPPYEYALHRQQLEEDGFHPTSDCMNDWFWQAFQIDLKA